MTRQTLFIAILAAALALAACVSDDGGGNGGGNGGSEATVDIEGFAFAPEETTVSVGDTVTWTNLDGVSHTVTANDQTFSSDNLGGDESFSFTFEQAGTYQYFCSIHPSMTGTVIVE